MFGFTKIELAVSTSDLEGFYATRVYDTGKLRPDRGDFVLTNLFGSPLATIAFKLRAVGDTGLKTGWVLCRRTDFAVFC